MPTKTKDERPTAWEYERHVWRANKYRHDDTGRRIRDHIGAEVRRGARCPKCERNTEDFRGVAWLESEGGPGWAFHCKGLGNDPDAGHSFVALPAKKDEESTG